jgi:cyclophilin family peptidyl-prolyl cis-trans isomerase
VCSFTAILFAAGVEAVSAQPAQKQAVVETTAGAFIIDLAPDAAPNQTAHFTKLASDGTYDGTIFHRVIPNFMIQGGGMTADMKEKDTRPPIPLESKNGLTNQRGTIAMARTSDPHSATAQFFINAADNEFLNFKSETPQGWGYAVFGRVVSGQEVVDAIEKVRTGNRGGHGDVPLDDVTITRATVVS